MSCISSCGPKSTGFWSSQLQLQPHELQRFWSIAGAAFDDVQDAGEGAPPLITPAAGFVVSPEADSHLSTHSSRPDRRRHCSKAAIRDLARQLGLGSRAGPKVAHTGHYANAARACGAGLWVDSRCRCSRGRLRSTAHAYIAR